MDQISGGGMNLDSVSEQEHQEMALGVAKECFDFDILFDHAPVMMHSIDNDGRLVKVNRRWLWRLGYQRNEVLGRKSTEFLTEESRRQAIKGTLPLFWRVVSARNVGYQFVRKNGQTIDVLLDAEVTPEISGHSFTIAALRDGHDRAQWEQTAITIKALKELTRWQHELESAAFPQGIHNPNADPTAIRQESGQELDTTMARGAMGMLLEHIQDISVNLHALLGVHEELLDASVEQQRELLVVAKSIEKSLAHLADMTEDRQKSE